jgi:hypothetical protein
MDEMFVAQRSEDAQRFAATGCPPIRAIGIDTVRASLSGSEDSSESVSAYLRVVRRFVTIVPTAGALLSHHAGWQDGETQRKRERGSSAWRGNVDATLYLEAADYNADTGEARLTLRTLKVRDSERPAPQYLVRRRVELPGEIDRYGQPVTSCIIERDRRSREDREAEQQEALTREQQETDLRTLHAIAEHPEAATSQDKLRGLLGARKAVVTDSLARLMQAALVLPGRQRQPYQLTSAGQIALSRDPNRVVPSSSRLGPGPVPSSSPGAPLWGTGNDSKERGE